MRTKLQRAKRTLDNMKKREADALAAKTAAEEEVTQLKSRLGQVSATSSQGPRPLSRQSWFWLCTIGKCCMFWGGSACHHYHHKSGFLPRVCLDSHDTQDRNSGSLRQRVALMTCSC